MTELSKRLRDDVQTGMDRAGAVPAKDAVKVRPADWHAICDRSLMAADALDAQAREIAELTQRVDLAEEAENAAKDSFWAVYPTYCQTVGHGISTEAARSRLQETIVELTSKLEEAEKALTMVSQLSALNREFDRYMVDRPAIIAVDAALTNIRGK